MRYWIGLVQMCLLAASASVVCAQSGKLVIAHRGASGYLPEHTLEAKALAVAQGADFIEQDVVMTQDDQLVVLHDLTLERTTDVNVRFPHKARADGSFYVIDFALAELRTLRVSEGRTWQSGKAVAVFPERFPIDTGNFRIHTLQEELELLAGLQKSLKHKVGIYPELKSPWFHHQHGKDLAKAVLLVLRDFGYVSASDAVYVQSFDYAELVRVKTELLPQLGMQLKLVQLIADNDWNETYQKTAAGEWIAYDYRWMHSKQGVETLAKTVDGLGPSYAMLLQSTPQPAPPSAAQPALATDKSQPNTFMQWAHAAQLQVHPFTFRRDSGQLPAWANSFDELLNFFLYDVGVDGVFTDYPDQAVQVVQQHEGKQ